MGSVSEQREWKIDGKVARELYPSGAPKGLPCNRKRSYKRKKASAAAASLRNRGQNVEAYHCVDCHTWHVGHKMNQNRIENPNG